MSSVVARARMVLRIETRRNVALVVSPLILAAAWWMAWNGAYGSMYETRFTDVYIWEETSRAIKDSILTTGPILAGFSAWAAGREARRGTEDLLSSTAKPRAPRIFATWAGTVLPFVAVYLLLALLLGIPTALNATWGAPLPGYLLVGLVALLMDSALGFAAGHYLPSRFVAPLVAISLYVLHLMPMGFYDVGINYTLLSPAAYSNLMGADVFHEPPRLALPQLLFFGGLGAAALSAVLFRGVKGKVHITSLVSLAVCAVGLVLALATAHPDSVNAGEPEAVPFEPVCEKGDIRVCVHPAYAKLLPETVKAVNEAVEPVLGIPGAPSLALQSNGPATVPSDIEMENTVSFYTPGESAKWDVTESIVVDEQAMNLSAGEESLEATAEDLRMCGDVRNVEYFDSAYEARAVVAEWLYQRTGGVRGLMYGGMCPNADKLVDRFTALSARERQAWLEKNFADLRAGEVTLKDLP